MDGSAVRGTSTMEDKDVDRQFVRGTSTKKYIRMAVMKDMPGGGSTTVDIPSWNPVTGELHSSLEDMHVTYHEACQILDERHIEMNMRIIETSGLRQYFTQEEWSKVISLFDILAGRQSSEQVRNRWESIREENRELEAARQAHLAAQQEAEVAELNGVFTGEARTSDSKTY